MAHDGYLHAWYGNWLARYGRASAADACCCGEEGPCPYCTAAPTTWTLDMGGGGWANRTMTEVDITCIDHDTCGCDSFAGEWDIEYITYGERNYSGTWVQDACWWLYVDSSHCTMAGVPGGGFVNLHLEIIYWSESDEWEATACITSDWCTAYGTLAKWRADNPWNCSSSVGEVTLEKIYDGVGCSPLASYDFCDDSMPSEVTIAPKVGT